MAEHKALSGSDKDASQSHPAHTRKPQRDAQDESLPSASLTVPDLTTASHATLLQLQGKVGNRAVTRLVHTPAASGVQSKGGGKVPGRSAPDVGLKQDMPGTSTGQSLGEFQESEALPTDEVIGPQTTDLLMMEPDPSETGETATASNPPRLEERLVPMAGEALSDASLCISNFGVDLSYAGSYLFNLDDESQSNAGYLLQDAGLLIAQVHSHLVMVAHFMKTSVQGSGKIPAGERLKIAAENLSLSAKPILTSAGILGGLSNPAFQQAGPMLTGVSSSLQDSSVMLGSAASKLGAAPAEIASSDLVEAGRHLVVAALHLASAGNTLLAFENTVIEGKGMVDAASDLQDAGNAIMRAGSILGP